MNYIKKLKNYGECGHKRISLTVFASIGLVVALTACSVSAPQGPQPVFQNSDEAKHIFTLSLLEGDTQEILAQEYDAEVIVWEPEDGFAILSSTQDRELLPQSLNIEDNKNSMKLPVFANGKVGWANGKSGWISGENGWSEGKNGWSEGKDGWSEGKDGWSEGQDGWSEGQDGWISGDRSWRNGASDIYLSRNRAAWNQIGLFESHAKAKDFGRSVKVAVIDTGVDVNHPMIADNLVSSYYWRDFIDGDKLPLEEADGLGSGHGTAVAGIILQIAPQAEIMPIRVLAKDGVGDMDNVLLAISHAVRYGADIINLSIGSEDNSESLKQMLLYAKNRGVFIVAAAGNTGSAEQVVYPAKMAGMEELKNHLFAVGSVDSNNAISSFSASSNKNVIFAPGENIRTSFPNNQLADVAGTSFAAPVLAGSLALVYNEMSSSDRKYMHSYIKSSIDREDLKRNFYKAGESWLHGEGILDINAFTNTVKIENPSFEDEMDDWVDYRTDAEKEFNNRTYENNEYLAKIENRGYLYQTFNRLEKNTSYEISFLIGFDNQQGSSQVELTYFNSSSDSVKMVHAAEGTTALQRVVIPFTTGKYNTYARIKIKNEAGNGNVFVDSFRLKVKMTP